MKIFILVMLCLSLLKMIPKDQKAVDKLKDNSSMFALIVVLAAYVVAIVFQSMNL